MRGHRRPSLVSPIPHDTNQILKALLNALKPLDQLTLRKARVRSFDFHVISPDNVFLRKWFSTYATQNLPLPTGLLTRL